MVLQLFKPSRFAWAKMRAISSVENAMPGGRYRSQFWFPSASQDVALALGIHGQLIYLDRGLGLVGVKLSSWPEPSNLWKSAAAIAMFTAIGRQLAGSTS